MSDIDRVAHFTKTSDVIEVKGEDPATPGCLREVRVRWCVGEFHSWVHALLSRSLRNPGEGMVTEEKEEKTKIILGVDLLAPRLPGSEPGARVPTCSSQLSTCVVAGCGCQNARRPTVTLPCG